jgi:hypothetical protein
MIKGLAALPLGHAPLANIRIHRNQMKRMFVF